MKAIQAILLLWVLCLRLAGTVHWSAENIMLCFFRRLCIWSLFIIIFVDKIRSGKYVKNFFSGAPHWPLLLFRDSCHLHCLIFASSGLGCTAVQKRVTRSAPRASAEPIWLPGGEYGILWGPGWLCSARPCQAGWDRPQHTKGQALGCLARSCYSSRVAVETGERSVKMRV